MGLGSPVHDGPVKANVQSMQPQRSLPQISSMKSIHGDIPLTSKNQPPQLNKGAKHINKIKNFKHQINSSQPTIERTELVSDVKQKILYGN